MELELHKNRLEELVEGRTAELEEKNVLLKDEIKEREKAERNLKSSEEKYRKIFNSPSDAILIHDASTGAILDVNLAMLEMYGYSHDEALQLQIETISQGEYPYNQAEAAKLVNKAVSEGRQTFEWIAKKKNGELFWVEVALKYTDFGRQRYVIGVVRDISKRKKSESELAEEKERLAVTLRSIGDGVITTNTKGEIVFLNKIAEELTGWRQEAAYGQPLEKIFHIVSEISRERCENPVDKVIHSGQIIGLANHTTLVAKDGSERSIADSGAPIRDKDSNIIGVVLVFRDVTEKNKMEQELLKVKKLESVGVLAGGIAHDFNNILAAILGNINLALMDINLETETRKRLTEAEKASIRAKDLTQQLLTFSKGGEPVKETTSIPKIIKDSAEFVLHGSNVACQYTIPDDLRLVNIDKGQMSQVIQNIIINANQAMPEGGIIHVTCENIDSLTDENALLPHQENYIKITLTDSGIGIPTGVIDKIFDPYFSTKQEGSGLGLAISHSIISKHNGHISVQSTPGVGTTFTIYLPASFQKQKKEKSNEIIKPRTGKTKIMVMDDEEMVRDIAQAMIDRLGHEVVLAQDGTEALELYKEQSDSGEPIDVIIMDLTIPGGMGGKEAVKEILAINPDAKVIVSSGYSNDPAMANCQEYGFVAAVVKPYQLQELTNVINQVLVNADKGTSAIP